MGATYAIEHLEQVRALASSGRLLAIGGTRATTASAVTLFDAGTRKVVRTLQVPTHVNALAFLGAELVVGGVDGGLHRFDSATGTAAGSVVAHVGGVAALCVDGGLLATTGADGKVSVWSAGTKKFEFTAPCPQRAVALDAANQRVAAGGDDGVVRVFSFGQKAPREMAGHRGAVCALAFTPRDGRLASTGDDGTTRLWYLEGAVECEVRGEGDTGHAGGTTAMVFLPSPKADAKDQSDRLVSTGVDAKIRTVRLDDKKRSKTFDAASPQRALALVETDARTTLTTVVAAGDGRTLTFIDVGLDGAFVDSVSHGVDGFAGLALRLHMSQRAAKEALAKSVPTMPEAEAVPLLEALSADKDTSVRLELAKALAQHRRRDARPLLRALVKDKDTGVAQAALAALAATEEQPFAAYREGLRGTTPGVRLHALKALPGLYPAVPLVPALISDALKDADAAVRLAALDALQRVLSEGVEALVLAFDKGSPDVRAEVLVRGLLAGKLPQLQSISGRALDDADVVVRQMAFVVRVLERPALGVVLQSMLQLPELFRRANGGKEPNQVELVGLKAKLKLDSAPTGELSQDDLTPLLVAMSAKAADVASRGAAGLLVAANDVRAVSALLQLSQDDDASQRLWVARVFAGLADPRAVQRLASLVDDRDASVRAVAAEGLAKSKAGVGPLELPGILLRSAHEDMRKRGLTLLVGLPVSARDDDAETMLGHALEDEAASVRNEAFKTLWAWHEKNPQVAIDRALHARFADLRLGAVRQLALMAKAPTDDEQAAPPLKSVAPWVLDRLEKAVADREASVSEAALITWSRLLGPTAAKPWLTGLESEAISTRALAARKAAGLAGHTEAETLRSSLVKALSDPSVAVKLAALDTVDALIKDDAGPLGAGLMSDSLEVRVRAAELLAKRGDEIIIEPMRGLVIDPELKLRHPPAFIEPLRARATGALATLGSPRTAAFLAEPLLKDENPGVREQAARGLCTSGAEKLLLDALGHADVAVRSWAAEGLARLGDDRGLAVLTGTLRDPHLPIREGALRALVALGPAGDNALFLGLDDPDSYLSDTFFATLLARDLRAAREGNDPELLTAALSAKRPDVRYAAARALELRADVSEYTQLLLDTVSPPKPEKALDVKAWPEEGERERLAMRLVQLLAVDTPQGRYAAGQALLLRRKPLEFFAEVKRVVALRPAAETTVPDTTQRPRTTGDAVARKDWLRKLFAGATKSVPTPNSKDLETNRQIAFGAYVGLLRLSSGDETVRRVRRDVVDRMVAMARAGSPRPASVIPALVRALDDDDGLVRKAAMAGLNTLLEATPDVALRHALASASADVGLLALEQLDARGQAARPWFVDALSSPVAEVRRQAFVLLERSHGPGSQDALMAALASPHADLRLGVLQKLAASQDARVLPALRKALESDRDDVRLLAAELLAERKDDACVPALAAFLTPDHPSLSKARAALATCATPAAAQALGTHLADLAALPVTAEVETVNALKREAMAALASTRQRTGLSAIVERFSDPAADVRGAAFASALVLTNHRRPPESGRPSARFLRDEKRWPRWPEGVLETLRAASKAKDPELRAAAARELDVGGEPENDALLVGLFADRDLATRTQAVASYAKRVEKHQAPVAVLQQVVAQGARELMLSAAEGLAAKQHVGALQPLLLFARAGEVDEQVRAVLALGTSGQVRALEEIEVLAAGGTEDAPTDALVRAAAIEALGRLYRSLTEVDAKKRVYELVESSALEGGFRRAGARGLRWVGDDRAVSRLQQIVDDPSETDLELVKEAIGALASLGDVSSEHVLNRKLSSDMLADSALQALETLFPSDPLRVALSAASSELSRISGPALAYLLAEAEPGPLIERLANPRLAADLRAKVKYGLGRRASLPTDALVKYAGSAFASVRDDMAWLMARQVLAGTRLSASEQEARVKSLVTSATSTAAKWAKSVGTDKVAEEAAFLRLLWAATLFATRDVDELAAKSLAGGSPAPASVRAASARILERVGAGALPVLTRGAKDADSTVRRASVAAVANVAPADAIALIDANKPLDALAFDSLRADANAFGTDAARTVMLPKLIAANDSAALMAQAEKGTSDAVVLAALSALGRMGGEAVAVFLAKLAFSAGGGEDDDGEGESDDSEIDDDEGADDDDGGDDGDEDSGPSPDVSMPGSRRFEYEEDDSSKFWEVVVVDTMCTVRFGKIGSAGQKKPKKLASPEAAQKEMERLIKEKTGKGYVEVKLRGIAPPKPVVAPAKVAPVKTEKAPLVPWGTPELRKAAFRALRRAQRTNARRLSAPKWFTAEQLVQLAANPELAEAMMPPPPARREVDDGGDGDEGDEEDFDEDEEGDDE